MFCDHGDSSFYLWVLFLFQTIHTEVSTLGFRVQCTAWMNWKTGSEFSEIEANTETESNSWSVAEQTSECVSETMDCWFQKR